MLVLPLAPADSLAHGDFDCSSKLVVHEDRLQLEVSVGKEGAQRILASTGLSAEAVAQALKVRAPGRTCDVSPTVAGSFFRITSGERALTSSSADIFCDGVEAVLKLIYPKPESGTLELEALYFGTVPEMRDGSIILSTAEGHSLGGARLSRGLPTAQFALAQLRSGTPEVASTTLDLRPEPALYASIKKPAGKPASVADASPAPPPALDAERPNAQASNRFSLWLGAAICTVLAVWVASTLTRSQKVKQTSK